MKRVAIVKFVALAILAIPMAGCMGDSDSAPDKLTGDKPQTTDVSGQTAGGRGDMGRGDRGGK